MAFDEITVNVDNSPLDIIVPEFGGEYGQWKFVLCLSSNLSSLGELRQARQKQIQLDLNRPGSLSFTFPIADPEAYLIEPVRTCVLAYRNGRLIWSGPVWTIEERILEEIMQVTCVGWFEILYHRLIQPDQAPAEYTATDAGLIAQNLLFLANATGQTPLDAPSSTFMVQGSTQSSINRDRIYQAYENIGQSIQQLADIENGIDYHVHPWNRTLDVFYPMMGEDRPGVVLGAGDVTIKGLAQVTRTIDSSRMANRVWVIGGNSAGFAEDVPSQSTFILMEEINQLNDVNNDTILAAYANAELAVKSNPLVFVNFDIFPTAQFQMFGDFVLGDIIYVSARKGRMQFTRQPARVFGATITVDDGGVERVSSIKTRLG